MKALIQPQKLGRTTFGKVLTEFVTTNIYRNIIQVRRKHSYIHYSIILVSISNQVGEKRRRTCKPKSIIDVLPSEQVFERLKRKFSYDVFHVQGCDETILAKSVELNSFV